MWTWALMPFVLSAFLTGSCMVLLWRRQANPGARPLALLFGVETLWSIAYLGELSASTLPGKLFWDHVRLVAWLMMLFPLLLFTWDYCGIGPKRRAPWLISYALIPAVTASWVLTDPLHGHARADAHLVHVPPFDSLLYTFTFPERLAILQTYGVLLYASFALIDTIAWRHQAHRMQAALILLCLWLPSAVEVMTLSGFHLIGQRDLAPASFGLAAVPMTWALAQRRMLEIVPVARHAIFEHLPDPLIVLDAQQRVVDLNPCAQQALTAGPLPIGEPLEGILGAPAASLLTTLASGARAELKLGAHTYEARAEVLRTPRGTEDGRVLLLRDVTVHKRAQCELMKAREELERRVVDRTHALRIANENLHNEVRERKRAEHASRESERRFRALFDDAVQLMGTLAPDGTILEVNRAVLSRIGAPLEEVVGKRIWEGPWWREVSELQARVREAVSQASSGQLVQHELVYRDPEGNQRYLDFSLKPVDAGPGEQSFLIVEARDLTEHRRAEAERATLREQLHQAQRLDSIGRVAGGIAHDFNNLLTVILGQLELAQIALAQKRDSSDHLHSAMQAGRAAARLAQQLLAFARKRPSAPRELSINDVLQQAQRVLHRVAGEEVQLQLDLSRDLPLVRIDPAQLEQVLLNLTVNARDAMPEGGLLRMMTRSVWLDRAQLESRGLDPSRRSFVWLRVEDNGPGMPREVVSRVFEPFFTTKEPGKGTGIGLSTVYGVVKQAGGFVSLSSELGQGTRFDIYFPVAESAAFADRPSASAIGEA